MTRVARIALSVNTKLQFVCEHSTSSRHARTQSLSEYMNGHPSRGRPPTTTFDSSLPMITAVTTSLTINGLGKKTHTHTYTQMQIRRDWVLIENSISHPLEQRSITTANMSAHHVKTNVREKMVYEHRRNFTQSTHD